jgi:hypothetical protein
MSATVVFGSYNMSSGKCEVSATDLRSHPTNLIQREQVARQHGTVQVNADYNEKVISFDGRIIRPSGHTPTFREIQDEFDNAMSKNQKTLRIIRTRTKISDLDSATNWAAADDAANVTTNTSNYQVSNAALSFDVDVSASANNYATIANSSATAVNLSAVEETGNFEFWIYIPDKTYITSLDFTIGSDNSNYWGQDGITTTYDQKGFENGWNYISVYWPTMNYKVGSPVSSAIDYLYFRINYNSSMVDTTGFLVSGLAWVDEENIENYTATVESLKMGEIHSNIEWQPFNVSFLCNDPFSYSTVEFAALDRETLTSASKSVNLEFDGTYSPSPWIAYTINTPEGLGEITYLNETTNEQISKSTCWTAGDVFSIDTDTMRCYINGTQVDYDGTFPRHIVGKNRISSNLSSISAVTISQTSVTSSWTMTLGTYLAQSFTATATGTMTYVGLYLGASSGTSSTNVYIYSNSGTAPSALLLNVGNISVTSGYKWYWLAAPLAVSNTVKYWIVFDTSLRSPAMQYVPYGDGYYSSGETKWAGSLSGPWTSMSPSTGDMVFSLGITPSFSINYDWSITYHKRYV